jgi:antitoxin component YwqK of YwqJK toxin-antitoxin module
MRAVSILTVLIAIFAVGCGEKVVDYDKIVERDGVFYEVNSEEPFTGRAVAWYENGQKEGESVFLNGRPHGKSTGWYENGQKEVEKEARHGKRIGKTKRWKENGERGF